jgi:hypothetical protein
MIDTAINQGGTPYNDAFYSNQVQGSLDSANVVLGFLYEIYQPVSVVDVGCGRGAWLSVAEKLGSNKLTGMDGGWIDETNLLSKTISFNKVNFEESIATDENFDLCISLEVAEHIDQKQAEPFVQMLCKLSEVILFGAAIQYQGGTNHINEQWQTYWIELFKKNGYECLDIIRPNVWDNNKVEWWYKQNTFVFIKKTSNKISTNTLINLQKSIPNIVHPENYKDKVESIKRQVDFINDPPLKFCLVCIKSFIKRKVNIIKGYFK